MEKRNVKKLNKAAIATVLAASGVAAVAPQPTHATTFKDVNPLSDAYKPIMELSDRGIVNGFKDGTFRPNQAVTRGQAAKMIALALKLDVRNVKNPKFKDVPSNHQFYPYIAALAQKGIINGYKDQSFQPNEPITRGQIAKILSLGYGFEVASKLKHNFKDLTSKNSNAYYIQTLINLNITKGVTPTKFSPYSPVTRGQLATFLVRAENADGAHIPVNQVGKIEGNKVYINSVAYTIDSSLKSIFNESNAAVLQGAYIEGNISGTLVKSLTKLTINAAGTEKKNLVFNGNNSTYSGELVVKGSYIQFKNWTLTGTVTLAENIIRTLSDKRLQKIRIASVRGVGFIDWTKPTVPEESDILNPSENEDLTDKPSSNSTTKAVPKMPLIEKFVDFSNCWVNRLIIEQNRTHVVAKNKITTATVRGYVKQFELYSDVQTMYIEPETSVAMYGSTDIKTIYNNSYYDVFFNSNTYVDVLVEDNSYGWTDLGEPFYIGKVVLPKGKSPSDIFDDFKNDSGQIGDIEDEDGNPVDQDPIDDGDIPDRTSPIVSPITVTADSVTATATFTSNENGTFYYIVREVKEEAPTIREIMTGPHGTGVTLKDRPTSFTMTGLTEETEYRVYLVVVDNNDNVSEKKESLPFKTTDGTAPEVRNLSGEPLSGGKRVKITFNASEPGDYYYYVREKTNMSIPSTQDIINSPTGRGTVSASNEQISEVIKNLRAKTTYQIFVVMKDVYGNLSEDDPSMIEVETSELDNTHPFVVGSAPGKDKDLVPYGENQFYLYFNEELDKETAENVQNYDLSGTGIINVTGQKIIKPSKASYTFDSNGSRVLLTVPSFTGFVHGDTLRVTVLKGVKDKSDNEFENELTVNADETPRNYAEYRHDDTLSPNIEIKNVKKGPTKVEVEFETNKAGTFYYMIMPDDVNLANIKPRDFVDEFSTDPSKITGKFQDINNNNNNIYLYKEGNKPAMLGSQKFDITIPSNLDPFKSYAVYMVLRDRSGNLSQIKSKLIINDSKVPEITGITVKSVKNNDARATLSFNSSEKGTVYYKAIKKWVLDANGVRIKNPQIYDQSGNLKPLPGTFEYGKLSPERKAAFLGLGGVQSASMSEGLAGNDFIIRNLDRHQEYVLYFGVEDTYGNFTVKLPETDPPETVEYKKYMIKPFYTDGTKPEINPVIKKLTLTDYYDNPSIRNSGINYVEDRTFTITFSEAIALPSGNPEEEAPLPINQTQVINTLKDGIDNVLGTRADVTSIGWQEMTGVNTWEERKLVFTIDNIVNSDITINMNSAIFSNFRDLAILQFADDKSIGEYKYPTKTNTILYARLQHDIQFISDLNMSKVVNVMAELNVDLSWDQKYYYAVTTTGYPLSRADMEEVIRRADNNSNQLIPGSSIISYGMGSLTIPSDASSVKTFTAIQSPNNNASTNVFVTNQRVYLFTKDKYGNIVFATDATGLDYVSIQPRIN